MDIRFLKWKTGLFLDGDTGGAGTAPAPAAESTSGKPTDNGAGGTEAEKAGKEKQKADVTFNAEQQALVDKLVGEARVKEREKAKADLEAETSKARKKAEQDALKEKEDFKTLAEQREAEISELRKQLEELTPFKENSAKFEKALKDQLEAVKKSLPKHILPLIEKLDPIEAMQYIEEHRKELGAKLEHVPPTPPEFDQSENAHETKQAKEMQKLVKSFV
jgi:hypothetical protein